MNNFELTGGYTHLGRPGTFTGTMRIYDDHRLVGTMIDSGADIRFNKNKTKIIVGLRDEREMQLAFWKFSPSEFTAPLIYVVKHEATATGERYEGKWAPIEVPRKEILEGIGGPILEETFKAKNLQGIFDTLDKIEKSRIETYLNPNLIRDILKVSQDTGYLILKRVDSFPTQ